MSTQREVTAAELANHSTSTVIALYTALLTVQLTSEPSKSRMRLGRLTLHHFQDLWIAIDGVVYDVTDFQHMHPGGPIPLYQNGGVDGPELFYS